MELLQCDNCKRIKKYSDKAAWGRIVFKDPQRTLGTAFDEITFDVCPSCMNYFYAEISKCEEQHE